MSRGECHMKSDDVHPFEFEFSKQGKEGTARRQTDSRFLVIRSFLFGVLRGACGMAVCKSVFFFEKAPPRPRVTSDLTFNCH